MGLPPKWSILLVISLLLNLYFLLNYPLLPQLWGSKLLEKVRKANSQKACPVCPIYKKVEPSGQVRECPTCPACPEQKETDPPPTSSSPVKISETTNVVGCSKETLKWNDVGQPGNQFGCYLEKLLQWVYSLKSKERHVFAQHGEDGVTKAIFDKIGSGTKYYVEFGVQDGMMCNTRFLREQHNWTGLMMDSGFRNLSINLNNESVWIGNVAYLFKKYKVPLKFDYLSEDTDFSDFWLIKAVLEAGYKPRVIISEINRNHGTKSSLTVPSARAKAHGRWIGNRLYGTSALALTKLVHKYGYQPVYIEKSSVNIFFIHKSELHNTDLALAHWLKVISEGSAIGVADHPVQSPKHAHSHICVDLPCDSSFDW